MLFCTGTIFLLLAPACCTGVIQKINGITAQMAYCLPLDQNEQIIQSSHYVGYLWGVAVCFFFSFVKRICQWLWYLMVATEYEYFQFCQICGTLHCWINTNHHISLSHLVWFILLFQMDWLCHS